MKWVFVLVNLAAALAVVWAGMMVCNIHRVHSYSTFTELLDRKVIVSKPEKAAPEFDIAKSLEAIGGLDTYIPMITYGAAALFVLNAVAFMICWKAGASKPA
ncbi:MAG TPA: hypothetical protein VE981_18040 [Planctomycetota bacterium]|nr:hypothetical protein [Planctomycetota bacterium]